VMAPQRMCLGCQGQGHIIDPATAHCAQGCGRAMDTCGVCDGSGLVDARASREDALCDAETLRGALGGYLAVNRDRADVGIGIQQGLPWFASRGASRVARAAFRAIPALKGE
jgi:hypothetical protein